MTREPKIEHAVFVYRHRTDGTIYTHYIGEPSPDTKDYVLIASLDPALWIAAHYEDEKRHRVRAARSKT